MNRRLRVYKCPSCGHEIEIAYFGIPHTGSIACIECEENMQSIELEDSKYDYDTDSLDEKRHKSRTKWMNDLDEQIREFVEDEQPITEEEIRENVELPDDVQDKDQFFDKVFGLTKTILKETEDGFEIPENYPYGDEE